MTRLIIGGLLVLALLGLYVFAVCAALIIAHDCSTTCLLDDSAIAILLQTLGGLVSAVVVSELAVTKPTEAPGTRLARGFRVHQRKAVKILVNLYILVWLASGVVLIILGWVKHPTVPELTGVAKEWLGFAVAAAYAYFGLSADEHNHR